MLPSEPSERVVAKGTEREEGSGANGARGRKGEGKKRTAIAPAEKQGRGAAPTKSARAAAVADRNLTPVPVFRGKNEKPGAGILGQNVKKGGLGLHLGEVNVREGRNPGKMGRLSGAWHGLCVAKHSKAQQSTGIIRPEAG
jgi:hypothetical protein